MSTMETKNEEKFLIHKGAREGLYDQVRAMAIAQPSLLTSVDDDGRTPLHWACLAGDVKMVEILLGVAGGPDAILMADESGWTPVHIAAAIGSKAILELLLRYDGSLVNDKTSTGSTPLQIAIGKNHIDTARHLVETCKCNVRTKDSRGILALHRASGLGNNTIVDVLVSHGAPINATDSEGWTALHHALAEGNEDTAAELLRLGADASIRSRDDQLPIDVANAMIKPQFQVLLEKTAAS